VSVGGVSMRLQPTPSLPLILALFHCKLEQPPLIRTSTTLYVWTTIQHLTFRMSRTNLKGPAMCVPCEHSACIHFIYEFNFYFQFKEYIYGNATNLSCKSCEEDYDMYTDKSSYKWWDYHLNNNRVFGSLYKAYPGLCSAACWWLVGCIGS
jgi:hypothetical protein